MSDNEIVLTNAIQRIAEYIRKYVSDEHGEDDFSQGEKLAFRTVVEMLQNDLSIADLDVKAYGLDIDTDKDL